MEQEHLAFSNNDILLLFSVFSGVIASIAGVVSYYMIALFYATKPLLHISFIFPLLID